MRIVLRLLTILPTLCHWWYTKHTYITILYSTPFFKCSKNVLPPPVNFSTFSVILLQSTQITPNITQLHTNLQHTKTGMYAKCVSQIILPRREIVHFHLIIKKWRTLDIYTHSTSSSLMEESLGRSKTGIIKGDCGWWGAELSTAFDPESDFSTSCPSSFTCLAS